MVSNVFNLYNNGSIKSRKFNFNLIYPNQIISRKYSPYKINATDEEKNPFEYDSDQTEDYHYADADKDDKDGYYLTKWEKNS
jgi:hypothetical protein